MKHIWFVGMLLNAAATGVNISTGHYGIAAFNAVLAVFCLVESTK